MQHPQELLAAPTNKPATGVAQKPRGYRFTLRTLLLLTAIVALGAVWWNKFERQRRAVVALQNFGAEVSFRYSDHPNGLQNFLRQFLPRAYLDEVTAVFLSKHPWDKSNMDAALSHIGELEDLLSLNLICNVSDTGAIHLRQLTKLRHLDLMDTSLTDQGISQLSELKNLRFLRLPSKTGITDQGLLALDLKGKQALQELELHDTGLTDAGLASLQLPASLERLDLSRTLVSDTGLKHLSHLTALKHLSLSHTKVTCSGLPFLAALKSMRSLVLDGSALDEQHLVHLSLFPELIDLRIGQSSVTDQGLANLNDLPKLTTLGLSDTNISDAGLIYLENLTSLQTLFLNRANVTGSGLPALRAKLPRLTRIELK
jgi:Leucine-rich repeat (LRR) protein